MTHRIMNDDGELRLGGVWTYAGWIWKAHCLKSIMLRAKKSQTTSKRGLGV